MSLLVRSEMIGLFVNKMIADDMYSHHYGEKQTLEFCPNVFSAIFIMLLIAT